MTEGQIKFASWCWARGFDTLSIAKRMPLKEAVIWNHLEFIKRGAKVITA